MQLICEDKQVPVKAMARFYEMGENDSSPVVRLYLASALQRINDFSRFTLASKLVKHAADSSDHNLPKMIWRSEEHTSELQSLMRISYAVFCLKKNNKTTRKQ